MTVTATVSESSATAAAPTTESNVVSGGTTREGFALVQCGHDRLCESCALRVADLDSGYQVSQLRYAW